MKYRNIVKFLLGILLMSTFLCGCGGEGSVNSLQHGYIIDCSIETATATVTSGEDNTLIFDTGVYKSSSDQYSSICKAGDIVTVYVGKYKYLDGYKFNTIVGLEGVSNQKYLESVSVKKITADIVDNYMSTSDMPGAYASTVPITDITYNGINFHFCQIDIYDICKDKSKIGCYYIEHTFNNGYKDVIIGAFYDLDNPSNVVQVSNTVLVE